MHAFSPRCGSAMLFNWFVTPEVLTGSIVIEVTPLLALSQSLLGTQLYGILLAPLALSKLLCVVQSHDFLVNPPRNLWCSLVMLSPKEAWPTVIFEVYDFGGTLSGEAVPRCWQATSPCRKLAPLIVCFVWRGVRGWGLDIHRNTWIVFIVFWHHCAWQRQKKGNLRHPILFRPISKLMSSIWCICIQSMAYTLFRQKT